MSGKFLNGNFRGFYLRLQNEYRCRYLPGDKPKIKTNDAVIRKAKIGDVYKVFSGVCYNGVFLDNKGNEVGCFFDMPTSVIDNDLPIEILQYNEFY
jgi:hypothetical protein